MNKQTAFTRRSIVWLVIIIILSFVASVSAQDKPARTYYESLNLATPEDAAQTFVDAFASEDFWTVFMVFSPEAQRQWQLAMNSFKFDALFIADYENVMENFPPFDEMESFDMSALFDVMMFKAAQDDALLIDLRGETTFGSSTETTTEDGDPAVDISATVDGIKGEVIFRLVQSPSQRWRVLQVIVEGGDEEMLPWSVPSTTD